MDFSNGLCPICGEVMSHVELKRRSEYICEQNYEHFVYTCTVTSEIIRIGDITWIWELGDQPPAEISHHLNLAKNPRDDDISFYRYGL